MDRNQTDNSLLFPPWDTDLKLCTNRDASLSPAISRRKEKFSPFGDGADKGDGAEDEKCDEVAEQRQQWLSEHADTSWMDGDGQDPNAQDNVY